ncbi:Heat shock factor (HSF)-type, DNA-binding [Artemisia annua]|uniref:Heat shock factor (HSF)-type, DNA-binding n=1 Tax=Artemisia annua TaxID=35608 RepID=A0A2U1KM76_ARTAN|nr:Heat shock factor (HSF)-type, DNA-binding [Artemisia annua]
MVEDPTSDEVVSWSNTRNSFVVWDSYRFSTALLPKYFKHSNFSSFIRQLNTYGFKKVDPDRWEFANEGFLGGQRHLLKTIRRRRNVAQSVQPKQEYGPCIEVEIVRLRQLQQHSKDQLIAMENQLKATERKQQNMMGFLAKAFSNPEFLQKYMDKYANKEQEHIEIGRKRRLTMTPSVENLQENIDPFITAPFEEESSSNVGLVEDESHDNLWEELLNVDVPTERPPDDFLDDLDGQQLDWDEDLQELVDQMEYLSVEFIGLCNSTSSIVRVQAGDAYDSFSVCDLKICNKGRLWNCEEAELLFSCILLLFAVFFTLFNFNKCCENNSISTSLIYHFCLGTCRWNARDRRCGRGFSVITSPPHRGEQIDRELNRNREPNRNRPNPNRILDPQFGSRFFNIANFGSRFGSISSHDDPINSIDALIGCVKKSYLTNDRLCEEISNDLSIRFQAVLPEIPEPESRHASRFRCHLFFGFRFSRFRVKCKNRPCDLGPNCTRSVIDLWRV